MVGKGPKSTGKTLQPSLKFSTHPSNKWFRLPVVFPLDGSHSLFLWVKSPELIGSICSITIILGEMTSLVGAIHLFWGEVTLCRLLWTPGLRLWYSPPGRQAEDPLVPLGLTAHFGGLSKGLPHWRHFGVGFHKLCCWGGCLWVYPWISVISSYGDLFRHGYMDAGGQKTWWTCITSTSWGSQLWPTANFLHLDLCILYIYYII